MDTLLSPVRCGDRCGSWAGRTGGTSEGAAQIEVSQQVGTVEGGRVVGVDLGEVLGDVNIGNYTVRIGTQNGGVVNVAPPQQRQIPRPRPVPVMLLPRPYSGFLDRRKRSPRLPLFSKAPRRSNSTGPQGWARQRYCTIWPTSSPRLPRRYRLLLGDPPQTRGRSALGLLRRFLRARSHLPTPVQMRHALRDEQALVVLDDVDLEREEVEALMDAAPASVFLSAATERRLWSGGRTIALRGYRQERPWR